MRWSALCILRRMGASVLAQHITILSSLEGFFGRMKVEMFFGRDWSRATLDDLAAALRPR